MYIGHYLVFFSPRKVKRAQKFILEYPRDIHTKFVICIVVLS